MPGSVRTMQMLSAGVGLIGFIFMLVAICTNYWLTGSASVHSGLWRVCTSNLCDNLRIGSDRKYENYEMVRGFGVLAVCISFLAIVLSFISFIASVCNSRRFKIGPSVFATLYLLAALFGLTCIGLFTSIVNSKNSDMGRAWGYSFILGWVAFPLMLFSGVIMTYAELKMN
uniref:Uncharacterized protein n=1 Tax=Ciona savignyi TaxID=51511 RepID=H2ZND1_CIOSA